MNRVKQTADLKKILPWLLCLTLLSACGFQLRGAYQLPEAMHTTYVDASTSKSSLVKSLKRNLKLNNITLLDEESDGAAILKINSENKRKRIVSVDSKGRAREYSLVYEINFSVVNTQLNFKVNNQLISINRDFLFDTEDVLGNAKGEAQLYSEMQEDLVRLVLLRLQSRAN